MSDNDPKQELRRSAERDAHAPMWSIHRSLAVAALTALTGVAALAAAALAWIGHSRHPAGLSVSELLDVLKLVLGTVAGTGALFALVIAYRKQRLAEAGDIRERQRAIDDLTRVFNERYGAAAEQIGHLDPGVRLAGVYAMAGLADDWDQGRQTCINVLCAYLQLPYHSDPGLAAPLDRQLEFGRNQTVRHTIIAVITDRLRADAQVSWQGYDFDFSGVVFDGGDFEHAQFTGGTVYFNGAKFPTGTVSFDSAHFDGAEVDFTGVQVCGGVLSFRRAEFRDGRVRIFPKLSTGHLRFEDVRVEGTVLTIGGEVSGGTIDFGNATVHGLVRVEGLALSKGELSFDSARLAGGQICFADPECSQGSVISFRRTRFEHGGVVMEAPRVGGLLTFEEARFGDGELRIVDPTVDGVIDLATVRNGDRRTLFFGPDRIKVIDPPANVRLPRQGDPSPSGI